MLAGMAALVVTFGALPAQCFDFERYRATDLDALLAQPRPAKGIDIYPVLPLRLDVTLVSYATSCQTTLLRKAMVAAGITQQQVDTLEVEGCIKVRSAKGKELLIFVQDVVSSFLPKEIPLGSRVTLFAIHVFTAPEGPGLLVNEFSTGAAVAAGKSGPTSDRQVNGPPCGCGTADFHPGIDMTNDTAETPVRAVGDGVVVKVEEDDQAAVDVPRIGRCGRYVVLKHTYPNGHVAFTRYAQLGRVVGADGRPITPGMRVRKTDKIGEVGASTILHFEVRPVVRGTAEPLAGWTSPYASDPAMEWSRYESVDPKSFDIDTFGKIGTGRSRK
jgi:hypothetical protein